MVPSNWSSAQCGFETEPATPHGAIADPSPVPSADLEWKLIYVGSAESEDFDQVLDSVLVGPVYPGQYRFVFQVQLSADYRGWWGPVRIRKRRWGSEHRETGLLYPSPKLFTVFRPVSCVLQI